jgi:hypothetical protein
MAFHAEFSAVPARFPGAPNKPCVPELQPTILHRGIVDASRLGAVPTEDVLSRLGAVPTEDVCREYLTAFEDALS